MKRIFVAFVSFFLAFGTTFAQKNVRIPKVALVLGGGGARGLAEIPLVEAIEREGIKVDMVLGTSIGSLLGALYASGYSPKEMREMFLSLDVMSAIIEPPAAKMRAPSSAFADNGDNFFAINFSHGALGASPALLGDQNILALFDKYYSKVALTQNFDDLPIPFRAVGTDISTGEKIVFDSGPIAKAVRASMSIPIVWTPAPYGDGNYAFDGGLRDNIPILLAKELGADYVIAMDVSARVGKNPADFGDIASVSMQLFNLATSWDVSEQHKAADIVLSPELEKYSVLDFAKAKEIIGAGDICVEENRDKIHAIAQKIFAAGKERQNFDYNRESEYSKMPTLKIEKITVSDISFAKNSVLPSEQHFDKYVGMSLDVATIDELNADLFVLKNRFHFSSMSFEVKKGSKDGLCVVDVQAIYYKQNMNSFFAGGTVAFNVTNFEHSKIFATNPCVTLGCHIVEPFDMLFHLGLGGTQRLDFSLLPKIFSAKTFNAHFDAGAAAHFGSLEPSSCISFEDRWPNDDKGASLHAGLQFRHIDIATISAGFGHDYSFINRTKRHFNVSYGYFDATFATIKSEWTDFSGIRVEALARIGENFDSESNTPDGVFSAQFLYLQRFELKKNRLAAGISARAAVNRFPSELSSGYADFGGIGGMCGCPDNSFQRDFVELGASCHYRLFNVSGIPVFVVCVAKVGARDGYDCFKGGSPSNDFVLFDGFSISDLEYGGGAYLAVRAPFGNILVGATGNSRRKFCATIAIH